MTKVKYTKLHPMASVPQKGTEQAAAYDLFSIEDVYIPVGETVMIRTGLAMEIPHGWKGEIYSRSGLASKGIVVANSPGKIDSDYRGEIKVLLRNERVTDLVGIKRGDRIAQFEINPVHPIDFEESENLDFTSRGDQGFGSTGN
jgi:dUTP pyrophosphatase